jgi:CRP/FNR family transcriptional regulator, cyclic AMP receptor protein
MVDTPSIRMHTVRGAVAAHSAIIIQVVRAMSSKDSQKTREILKDIIIFHGLEDSELGFLQEHLEIQEFDPLSCICREGESGNSFFIILEGMVNIAKKDVSGKTHVLRTLSSGEAFGEMTLIDVMPRSASVVARDRVRAAELQYKSIRDLYHKEPATYTKILLNIAREFSRRLRYMDEKYVDFLQLPPEEMVKMH